MVLPQDVESLENDSTRRQLESTEDFSYLQDTKAISLEANIESLDEENEADLSFSWTIT